MLFILSGTDINEKGNIVLCLFNEIDHVVKYVEQPRKCLRLIEKEHGKADSTEAYKNLLSKEIASCKGVVQQNRLDRFYVLFPIMDRFARQLSGEVAHRVFPVINDVYRLQGKWDKYYSALYGMSPQY